MSNDIGKNMSNDIGKNYQQNPDGTWSEAIPLPFYYSLIPFLWLRLTGYKDNYGRKAQFIGWEKD